MLHLDNLHVDPETTVARISLPAFLCGHLAVLLTGACLVGPLILSKFILYEFGASTESNTPRMKKKWTSNNSNLICAAVFVPHISEIALLFLILSCTVITAIAKL